ncbi:alpha-1,6-mannosyl-glycoprotein 2-beta-N-acetylglucosaminyltransferase-like [Diorhabda sublineata]|uniref:alpha-1,6-mannosyl-glycoprotein 2-beta-N-acetylglucosaminyltransferase-like n=1 Tax=Diorhabda sublineata TaxID=1163346 RepID=UPI0024E12237|nr:alpha-1,6-mannosyl-glycoprotein 2-beta-N-acetylglucosaminyltransferase-like [Diorhabda sublineata]
MFKVMGFQICSLSGNCISQLWSGRNKRLWSGGGVLLFFLMLTSMQLNFIWWSTYHQQLPKSSPNITFSAFGMELSVQTTKSVNTNNTSDIFYINQKITQYNREQIIHNQENFETLRTDSVILVIQVHNRISYLRYLIGSLAKSSNISQALLIFSHDYYEEEINDLIKSINFCKVMQIFYPYSIQTHPNEFPGSDPNDCPRDISSEVAIVLNCNNALNPDIYGHYREAKFTQTKHHWWWKANRVFNELEVTKNHEGLVVFLEEDHYVAEDFIHVLKLMERSRKANCANCNILSLGTYSRIVNYKKYSDKVETLPWISSKHNMGLVLNKSTWMDIVKCTDYFCTYDDYNWDWSLQYISKTCLKEKLYVMVPFAPRIFHTGECGLHHSNNNCESTKVLSRIQRILDFAKSYMYPNNLTIKQRIGKNTPIRANGGWGDKRDHKLCIMMTSQQENHSMFVLK